MSAFDFIKAGKAKDVKKNKVDVQWNISGSTLFIGGKPVEGAVEWERSQYLKIGNHKDFYAYISGSVYVLPELKREGYVEPPKLKWGMPIPVHEEGDDE